MSEPTTPLATDDAPLPQRHRAELEAEAATALPRYWPAWAALVIAMAAAISHVWPWGFAPGL